MLVINNSRSILQQSMNVVASSVVILINFAMSDKRMQLGDKKCLCDTTLVRSGQVRSECLTCTFRASCRSACLSWAQVPGLRGFLFSGTRIPRWSTSRFYLFCTQNRFVFDKFDFYRVSLAQSCSFLNSN